MASPLLKQSARSLVFMIPVEVEKGLLRPKCCQERKITQHQGQELAAEFERDGGKYRKIRRANHGVHGSSERCIPCSRVFQDLQ